MLNPLLLFWNLPSPFRNLYPTSDFNDTGVRFECFSLRKQYVGFRDLGRRCVNHKSVALYTQFCVSFPLFLDNKRPYSEEKRATLWLEWLRIFMGQ